MSKTERLRYGAPQREVLSRRMSIYMLVVMAFTALFALVDRYLLSILLVPIQQDIQVSDTAMGFLGGFAFALFYAVAGIPVGRYADRGNRRNLLAGAVALWSAASMFCGAAANYLHLLVARIGVAAGESAASPANMSMIADLFPERNRATAISAVQIGSALGVVFGAVAAGVLNDLYGWRVAFVVIGAPGLLLALLIWLSFPEPVRGTFEQNVRAAEMDSDSRTIGRTLRYLLRIPTFATLITGKAMMQIAFQAWMLWLPTFLIRVHEMTPAEMGIWFGLSSGVGGALSAVIGGPVSDYLARFGKRWYLIYCGLATTTGIPLSIVALTTGSKTLAIGLMFVYAILVGSASSPSVAAGLAVVRPRMRGFMTVVTYICVNLVGAGIGPLIIGATSDALAPSYGDEAIRYALLIVPVTLCLSTIFYLAGSRTIEKDASNAAAVEAAATE